MRENCHDPATATEPVTARGGLVFRARADSSAAVHSPSWFWRGDLEGERRVSCYGARGEDVPRRRKFFPAQGFLRGRKQGFEMNLSP